MRAFELTVGFPTGTILIGGHSALPIGASLAHARDREGRPFLPATALRGALRESLEALLRGAGQGACEAGTGVDPWIVRAGGAVAEPCPCVLAGGARCVACRLFGGQAEGLPEGARCFSSLILGDAVLAEGEEVRWSDRQHVAVSRATRSAENHRLFLRRVPQLQGRHMIAHGYTVAPELDRFLEAAVQATTHLGSGRSVGLARVELKLQWREDISDLQSEPPAVAQGSELRIRVTLKSPTMLGGAQRGDNYRPTRDEIPGSVLRGALGFAIARARPDSDSHEVFEELVDEERGAQFGFLYPVDPEAQDHGYVPGPWPLTARGCKTHPHEHGVVDTLFDRLAAASIARHEQARSARSCALDVCRLAHEDPRTGRHSSCRAPLRGAKGTRGFTRPPQKRVVTRVSLDRRSASAREGALFSYELLEPGAVFEGTIRNVPGRARGLLAAALELPVHVGRGASSGWGKVDIEVIDSPPQRPSLRERARSFLRALEAHFDAAGLPTEELPYLLPVTFLAPFLPDPGDEDGRETLARALGGVRAWPVHARRFTRCGGWDQRRGRPTPELAISGGAVYVARLGHECSDSETLGRLEALEREGLGRRRHPGDGHAIFFDPFILEREQRRMNPLDLATRLRPLRRALVVKAEAVIERAFAGGTAARPPTKTQFSRLVNVCGEASCAEEIENYLRYQAGRNKKKDGGAKDEAGWRVEFVDAVVEGLHKALGDGGKGSGELTEKDRDLGRVEAWRLYATYLTRAFTYKDAIEESSKRGTRGRRR